MSNKNQLNILDLPNEIILMILNKLHITDALSSFVNVTQRFDQLVLDPLYTRRLDMTSMTMKSFRDRIYSIDQQVLQRICQDILPRIHHQIKKLTLEPTFNRTYSFSYQVSSTLFVITC